jgi:low affinity Fe/Cu permease
MHHIRHWLTILGVWTSYPAAFAVVVLYAAGWLIFSTDTFDWHAVATMATWAMTLFIVRAEHRDTQALHAKLDELLAAHGEARSDLARLDEQEPEEIVRHRNEARAAI